MQWHKAKVSTFCKSGQSLDQNSSHKEDFEKLEGDILKLKKWGEDEGTTLCTKLKV
jgi:hypothetical protein